ncbi:MAG TPA: transposase [Acetobacteraceae bacterium]|nr:transposase [Acetobacteraceae bacterium]
MFADSAYAGERVAQATRIAVEIVRKTADQVGFQIHRRRWVVERFFAWIGRNRRLSRDAERLIASVEAFLYAASAVILLRRLDVADQIRNGLSARLWPFGRACG